MTSVALTERVPRGTYSDQLIKGGVIEIADVDVLGAIAENAARVAGEACH
jgi:hypothetical protein